MSVSATSTSLRLFSFSCGFISRVNLWNMKLIFLRDFQGEVQRFSILARPKEFKKSRRTKKSRSACRQQWIQCPKICQNAKFRVALSSLVIELGNFWPQQYVMPCWPGHRIWTFLNIDAMLEICAAKLSGIQIF